MSNAGEIRSLLDLVLMLWSISFKVDAEKEKGSSNIKVRVQNSGIHAIHITDICICDEQKKPLLCINAGKEGKLGWNSNLKFPKILTRNEPCFCIINLPVAFAVIFHKPESIYVMATDSTGKTRFSEGLSVDW